MGLVGLADPRHRWFLAPAHRRRAGIRVVAASEPDAELREPATVLGVPIVQDHLALLDTAKPDLVAVTRPAGRRSRAVDHPGPGDRTGPAGTRAIVDALHQDADVVAIPPLADELPELDTITAAVEGTGRRCLAATTLRGQPAALLARQLLADHQLGRLELVSLLVADDCDTEEVRSLIVDVLDLFCMLTGAASGTICAVDDGHPARAADPAELSAGYGKLIMIASTSSAADGSEVVCEVRRRPTPVEWPVTVQVGGSTGAVEWDVRSGMLRSAVAVASRG